MEGSVLRAARLQGRLDAALKQLENGDAKAGALVGETWDPEI